MSLSKPNASPATNTRNRISPSPTSGLCVVCLDGCIGLCEVAKSAIRGRELIYPQPFGKIVAGSEKNYPIDFSHFNIQGTCVGAVGIEADSDKAIFPAVDISIEVGAKSKIKLDVPFFTGALGSTEVARVNWEEVAVGAAICGTIVVVGENVCGMDHKAEFKNGRVVKSPELERRVNTYKRWYNGRGTIVVQYNVEDGKLGVPEYALELGVEAIEPKWGQGAKDIGGEVKLPTLERALELKKRGYIVHPDPENPLIQKAYKQGAIKEFERHSRLGMVEEEAFYKEVARLRKLGFKYVTLKTGAYRPADLARAVKYASNAKIDLLTVDGAGGGTGMSPWRMMNEWGIPTVELECLLYQMLKRIEAQGQYIPPVAMAGGLSLEDHIFKAIALASPYVKAICMGRATFAAAMAAKTVGRLIKEGKVPEEYKKYGDTVEQIFVAAETLKAKYRKDFEDIPVGAIGMYTYYDRLATGLKQLMAGERKFALKHITRDDIFALTREAASISGIPYVMDCDKEEINRILG
ncbi:MAG: FMN-binding glutamate synthase family protein [Candidatus Omnitrophica bacterium CG23_combo_of_CG06-09_8_20_14_all_40_11]|nr:MAG: FMN-binding glutamate synthase family protein [Candidatus Omnitrophica bacterium CG23_combo_of_CG06-09_8_20_14_all_40_11]